LAAFLREKMPADRFQPLIESLFEPAQVERAFDIHPDSPHDLESGADWLRTVPDGTDIVEALEKDREYHRATSFLARTFLYLAYADIHQLRLTPDQARTRAYEPIVRSEQHLRQMLLKKLGEEFEKSSFSDEEVRRNITPLASVVFSRSRSDPNNIAEEMLRLRRELTPLRERLGEVEQTLESGTRDSELAIARKWKLVFQEIENKFGEGAGRVSVENILALAEAAGKFAEKPKSPGTWAKLLNLPVDIIRKIVARRPTVEIHRLEFPSSVKLQKTALDLFGKVLKEPRTNSQ
jgi:hypothetical protein